MSINPNYPTTADEREAARQVFAAHTNMTSIAYVRLENEDGKVCHVLYDAKGYCLVASCSGQFEIIRHAISNGITIVSVH